jgi:anti-sigma regulatory factor (Ser/Thr protein kinase)
MSPAIDLKLRSAPGAPGEARRALNTLKPQLRAGLLDEVRLLVSELVTNSYKYAAAGPEGWIALRVETDTNSVRVEVCDGGVGFEPQANGPAGIDESGWGLYLVRRIADRWGVTRGDSCCVWFELSF